MAEGAQKPSLDGVKIVMWPKVGTPFSPQVAVVPDAEGRFHYPNVELSKQRILIQGIPGGYYVKEIRHNGSPIPGDIVDVTSLAMAHVLEVEMDDKPAAIMGSVTDQDRPVARAFVVVARWPLPEDGLWPIPGAVSDQDGKFQLGGLAPGQYRVAAISAEAKAAIEKSDDVLRLLSFAKEVIVGSRDVKTLNLELTSSR